MNSSRKSVDVLLLRVRSPGLLTPPSRLAPLVSGKDGQKLRLQVWSEIVEGVKKDIPGITDAIARLKV